MNGELMLTGYTILSQSAIGLVLMMFFGSLFIGERVEGKRYHNAFLTAAVLSIVAMGISVLHLGSPLRAMNSLANLGSSWLSREILLTNLFFAAVAWGAYTTKKGGCHKAPLLAGAVLGFFCVLCQAAIYASTVLPAWSFGHAYITFFAATLILGAFLAAYFLLGGMEGAARQSGGKILLIYTAAAFASLIFAAGFYVVFAGLLSSAGPAGQRSLELLSGYQILMALRWLCSGAAIIGLAALAYKRTVNGSIALLFLLAVAGEGIQRLVFYCIGVNNGL